MSVSHTFNLRLVVCMVETSSDMEGLLCNAQRAKWEERKDFGYKDGSLNS